MLVQLKKMRYEMFKGTEDKFKETIQDKFQGPKVLENLSSPVLNLHLCLGTLNRHGLRVFIILRS